MEDNKNNEEDIPSSNEIISSILIKKENENENKNENGKENEKLFENQNDSIQFSKIFKKEETKEINIDDSKNLFSTKVFIKSIDLRCEDHLSKYQDDMEATRFCQKCNVLCCDACVIDYHIDHINLAKKKVDEFFISQKNHIVELNNQIQESIKYKINEKEIDKIVNSQKKIIEDFFLRRKDEIDISKKKLENVLNFEKELKDKMLKAVETFYKDECFKRLKVPIENNERLANQIERFIKDWAKFNKREKVQVLKNNVILEFEKESENNINRIQEEMKNFKGKSIDIEKKINGLLDVIGKNDKFNDLDKIYSEMNEKYLNIMKDIGDLKYDKLTIQKIENIKNKKAEVDNNYRELFQDKMFNNNLEMNNNPQIQNQIRPPQQYQNIPPQQQYNNIQQNQQPYLDQPGNAGNNNNNEVKRMDSDFGLFQQNSGIMGNNNNFNENNNFNNNMNNSNNNMNNRSIYNNINNNMNNSNNFNNMNNFNNNVNNNINNNMNNNFNNNVNNNMNNNMNNNFNNNMNNDMNKNNNNLGNNINNNVNNNIYNNNPNINPNNNDNMMNNLPQNNFIDEQIKKENKDLFRYDLLIYIKDMDHVYTYNSKYGFQTFKLDANNGTLSSIPSKSKFVNLGTSVLLSGGQIANKNSKKCYLISFFENENNPEHYDIKIDGYGDFNEGRERHNLLFLPDKNYIFACSGFYSKSCEYSKIYELSWTTISPLNKSRGNATMAYVNERYVYVLGGFNLSEGNKNGIYLSDIEYFDLNNFGKGWTTINYINNRGYNVSLTALGVIPISKSIFLICGGYDGIEYKKNVYKIDCTNHEKPTVILTQELENPTIFTHNMFSKIKNSYFNLDFNCTMHGFDYENWRFGILKMNKNN